MACCPAVQLKVGLNPLKHIADGPYLDSLLHLDIRGAHLTTLPQVSLSVPCLPFCGSLQIALGIHRTMLATSQLVQAHYAVIT